MKIKPLPVIVLFLMVCMQTHGAKAQPDMGAFKKRLAQVEEENLNTPYVGIVTSEGVQKGLFPIKSTGVSTEPIKNAAESFLKSLGKEQLSKTQFEVQDKEWQKWANVDNGLYKRQGVSIKEMSKEQRKLAFQLMQEALSAKGLQLSKDIMKTDQTLRELNNDDPFMMRNSTFLRSWASLR